MTTDTDLTPVRKEVTVGLPVETAFRLFTEGIATWWPLHSHSVGGDRASTVTMDPRVDGHITERLADGTTSVWGEVRVHEPPRRVVFTWHPGRDTGSGQEVEVTFTPVADGTRVALTHRGWEHLGERAAAVRENYVTGWDVVLGRYVTTAEERAHARQ